MLSRCPELQLSSVRIHPGSARQVTSTPPPCGVVSPAVLSPGTVAILPIRCSLGIANCDRSVGGLYGSPRDMPRSYLGGRFPGAGFGPGPSLLASPRSGGLVRKRHWPRGAESSRNLRQFSASALARVGHRGAFHGPGIWFFLKEQKLGPVGTGVHAG